MLGSKLFSKAWEKPIQNILVGLMAIDTHLLDLAWDLFTNAVHCVDTNAALTALQRSHDICEINIVLKTINHIHRSAMNLLTHGFLKPQMLASSVQYMGSTTRLTPHSQGIFQMAVFLCSKNRFWDQTMAHWTDTAVVTVCLSVAVVLVRMVDTAVAVAPALATAESHMSKGYHSHRIL